MGAKATRKDTKTRVRRSMNFEAAGDELELIWDVILSGVKMMMMVKRERGD